MENHSGLHVKPYMSLNPQASESTIQAKLRYFLPENLRGEKERKEAKENGSVKKTGKPYLPSVHKLIKLIGMMKLR